MKLEIIFKDGRKEIFDSVESFKVTEEKISGALPTSKVAKIPTEGMLFEVNPLEIDRSLFEKKINDQKKEEIRQIIQEAFAEMDKDPLRYASKFYTLIPEKCLDGKNTVSNLEAYATNLGGQMADWVEQGLEWAQRLSNGESWDKMCYNADTVRWYRIVVGKYNHHWRIGGLSRSSCNNWPASNIHYDPYRPARTFDFAVPLVRIDF